LLIERFYPEPLRISGFMLGSIFLMIAGGCHEIPEKKQQQIKTVQLGWAWCPSGYVGSSFTYGIGKG